MASLSPLTSIRRIGNQSLWFLAGSVFAAAARRSASMPGGSPPNAEAKALRRRHRQLLATDHAHARAGDYPLDLLVEPRASLLVRGLPRLLTDLPRTLERKRRSNFKDVPAWSRSESYPAYYRRNFHWQTDGYFSERSAALYDVGVELLFRGSAEIMRRQILPPIARLARQARSPLQILDVGSGTGASLDAMTRACPREHFHGVDLSPPYVRHARRRLGARADVRPGNGEALDFPDASMDVVTSVFLFHELPRRARRRVLSEAYRVLRPGGLLVLLDSAQRKDSGEIEHVLRSFPREYHEPYYEDYLGDPLDDAARECGFAVERSEPHFVSLLVVARKPRQSSPP